PKVQEICSVESDLGWYRRVGRQLDRGRHRYRFVDVMVHAEGYWEIDARDEAAFDLAVIDGLFRKECMESAVRAVRPGGLVYVDNIDTEGSRAFSVLQASVAKRGGSIDLFTGFPPAQPTVTT